MDHIRLEKYYDSYVLDSKDMNKPFVRRTIAWLLG